MIGLSLTSTVRRVEAERDEARFLAEYDRERAKYWQGEVDALRSERLVLNARIVALQEQVDRLPVRDPVTKRFVRRAS